MPVTFATIMHGSSSAALAACDAEGPETGLCACCYRSTVATAATREQFQSPLQNRTSITPMLPMLTNSSLLRHRQTLMPPSPAAPQGAQREFTLRSRPVVAGYRFYGSGFTGCEEPRTTRSIFSTQCVVSSLWTSKDTAAGKLPTFLCAVAVRSSPEALKGD